MADRFKGIQSRGITLAQPRRIDFANLREEQKAATAMASSAGRIGDWAMKMAHEQAAIEGEAYYAENPVTLQQIEDAKAMGKDPDELLPGNWTTFEKAGRKTLLQQISSQLELKAQMELASIQGKVKTGELSVRDLSDPTTGQPTGVLADLIDGLSSSVKGIDGTTYSSVRAKLGMMANGVLSSAITEQANQTLRQRKVDAMRGIAGVIKSIPAEIAKGDVVDPVSGETITVADRLEVYRQSVDDFAVYSNDATIAKQAFEDFDKAIVDARKSALIDWGDMMADGPGAALSQVRSGNISDPAMKKAYDALDVEEQAEVRKELRTLRRNRVADRNAELDARKKERDLRDEDEITAFVEARENGDREAMAAAVNAMSSEIRPEYEAKLRGDPSGYAKGVSQDREGLERSIMMSGMNVPVSTHIASIDKSLAENKITQAEASDLYKKVVSRNTEHVRRAMNILKARIRYDPEAEVSSQSDVERAETNRRRVIYEDVVGSLQEAVAADPTLDVGKYLGEALPAIEARENRRMFDEAIDTRAADIERLRGYADIDLASMTPSEINTLITDASKGDRMLLARIREANVEIARLQSLMGGQ